MFQDRSRGPKRWFRTLKGLIALTALIGADAIADKLVRAKDGDTAVFSSGETERSVRLAGIEALEKDQPMGPEATEKLVSLVKGKEVRIDCNGATWGRDACSVFVGTTDVQAEMVRAGFALDSPRYSGGKYAADQAIAKKAKAGMWSKPGMVSPTCWKKMPVECDKNPMYEP